MSTLFNPNQILGRKNRLIATINFIKKIPIPNLNSKLQIFVIYLERFQIVCPFYELLIKPFSKKTHTKSLNWTECEKAAFKHLKIQVCAHLVQWTSFRPLCGFNLHNDNSSGKLI